MDLRHKGTDVVPWLLKQMHLGHTVDGSAHVGVVDVHNLLNDRCPPFLTGIACTIWQKLLCLVQ